MCPQSPNDAILTQLVAELTHYNLVIIEQILTEFLTLKNYKFHGIQMNLLLLFCVSEYGKEVTSPLANMNSTQVMEAISGMAEKQA